MWAEGARQARPGPGHAPPSFAHLCRLTDDTGLLEHALGRVPRRVEGYTTDDNARALWVATEWLSLPKGALRQDDRSCLQRLAETYTAFLLWTQGENGWWHNNMAYDRTPEPEEPSRSNDCQGRSLWAAADAWVRLEGPIRQTAGTLVARALPKLDAIDSLRGKAFAMAACAHLLEGGGTGAIDLPACWLGQLSGYMKRIELELTDAYRYYSRAGWHWYEPALTYSNGTLPWAMLRTFRVTRRQETLACGIASLDFLLETMTAEGGWLRPVGNDGWGTPEAVSQWDQQPLEMFKLALALTEAVRALAHAEGIADEASADSLVASASARGGRRSDDWGRSAGRYGADEPSARLVDGGCSDVMSDPERWLAARDACLAWFYGENDLRQPMCDPLDGSGCDGLMETGPNLNCGAESTLAYLMTEALCQRVL